LVHRRYLVPWSCETGPEHVELRARLDHRTPVAPIVFVEDHVLAGSHEERPAVSSYTTTEVAAESRRIAAEVVGDSALDHLGQAMLDHETPPFRLGMASGIVGELFEPIRQRLSTWVEGLDKRSRTALAETFPDTGYRRDLAQSVVQFAVHADYFALPESIYRSVLDPSSRVLAALPDLAAITDTDGLVNISGLRATRECLFIGDYALSFHQLLRRSFTSSVNDTLMQALLDGVAAGEIEDLRVAIDDRRLRLANEHQSWIEKDFWNGPPITETGLDRMEGEYPVVTVHGRPVGAEAAPWDPYDRFAVRWSIGPGPHEKTMEAEELVEPGSVAQNPLVLLRFAHAIRDTTRQTFRHLDGAVRTYTPEAYARRRNMQFATAADGINTHYRKVFRADGPISTQRWADIVAAWFRGNELALEYLGGLASTAA
jgi:hypothetical protein